MIRRFSLDDFPRERHGGQEFYRIPTREYKKSLQDMGLIKPDEFDFETDEDKSNTLFPYYAPDPKLKFPGDPALEDAGIFVKSGIARHTVLSRLEDGAAILSPPVFPGFSATQLHVFEETDWYGECFAVLDAHGWTSVGDLSSSLLERVREVEGDEVIEQAKQLFGDEWDVYILELAAKHFAEPLSRVWYVANMKSLYYCHRDDITLGYLWAEYQIKMKFELFALKHLEMTEKNRESGMKGGQGEKKRERYEVLDRLARQKFKTLAFASNKEFVRLAKAMAADYDLNNAESLFLVAGNPLSSKWYDEWVDHFRLIARGSE